MIAWPTEGVGRKSNQGEIRMFKKIVGAVAVTALVSGCVSVQNKPLAADASKALAHKSLAYTEYARADFAAMTAGKAMFGGLGGAAMVHAGNEIVTENNIGDPALDISAALASRLEKSQGMTLASAPVQVPKDDVGTLVAHANGADFLLDVKTLNWMFAYYPTSWSHYHVMYAARMRLIDVHTHAVVAETMCKASQPAKEAEAPTHDELISDHAAKLKSLVNQEVQDCVNLLSSQILHV